MVELPASSASIGAHLQYARVLTGTQAAEETSSRHEIPFDRSGLSQHRIEIRS
jgi:hypothetical protein